MSLEDIYARLPRATHQAITSPQSLMVRLNFLINSTEGRIGCRARRYYLGAILEAKAKRDHFRYLVTTLDRSAEWKGTLRRGLPIFVSLAQAQTLGDLARWAGVPVAAIESLPDEIKVEAIAIAAGLPPVTFKGRQFGETQRQENRTRFYAALDQLIERPNQVEFCKRFKISDWWMRLEGKELFREEMDKRFPQARSLKRCECPDHWLPKPQYAGRIEPDEEKALRFDVVLAQLNEPVSLTSFCSELRFSQTWLVNTDRLKLFDARMAELATLTQFPEEAS